MKCNCDYCKKEINVKPSRLKKQRHICCSRECSSKLKKVLYVGENNPNYKNRGAKSPLFKGEKIITDTGYVKIYLPKHPLSDSNGRILEHRYIAEKYIATQEQLELINGECVLRKELDVHHKDFDKMNNNKDNLQIVTKKEHAKIHQTIKHINNSLTKICEECGREYEVPKNRENSSKFCSIECANKHRHKKVSTIICPVCGKEFTTSQAEKRICCSVRCINIYKGRGSIDFNCDYCGKLSKMKKSRFNKSKTHFCSRECYIKYKKQ